MQVTYDLVDMSPNDLLQLRDTLLTALQTYHAGPRTILVQLCLAISGVALQLPAQRGREDKSLELFFRVCFISNNLLLALLV